MTTPASDEPALPVYMVGMNHDGDLEAVPATELGVARLRGVVFEPAEPERPADPVGAVKAAFLAFLTAAPVNGGPGGDELREAWEGLEHTLMALCLASGAEPAGVDLGPVVAVYVAPETDDQEPCIVVEMVGGPKRYARLWPRKPHQVEWGWTLGDNAIRVVTGTMPAV
jgi:hypothetical protein